MKNAVEAEHLTAAFARIAERLSGIQHDWWVIGSAALVLHGIPGIKVADIDILVPDVSRVQAILDALGAVPEEKAEHSLFVSERFARLQLGSLDVEVMAGLSVKTPAGLEPVAPSSRVAIDIGSGVIFVPELAELADILRRFGREKDLKRLEILERWWRGCDD